MLSLAHSGRAASLSHDYLYPTYGYTPLTHSWSDAPASRGQPWSPASSALLARSTASLTQHRPLPRPPAPSRLPRPAMKGAREIERRQNALDAIITAREGPLPSALARSTSHSRQSSRTPLSRSSSSRLFRHEATPLPVDRLAVYRSDIENRMVQPPHSRRHSLGAVPLSSAAVRDTSSARSWTRTYPPISSDVDDRGLLPTRSPRLSPGVLTPSSLSRSPARSPFRSPAPSPRDRLLLGGGGDADFSLYSHRRRSSSGSHPSSSTPSSRTASPTPSHHSGMSCGYNSTSMASALSPAADALREPRWRRNRQPSMGGYLDARSLQAFTVRDSRFGLWR